MYISDLLAEPFVEVFFNWWKIRRILGVMSRVVITMLIMDGEKEKFVKKLLVHKLNAEFKILVKLFAK